MERIKKFLDGILKPKTPIKLIYIPFLTALLIYSFIYLEEDSPVRYISYLLSAYMLILVVIDAIAIFKNVRAAVYRNKYTSRYLTESEYRARISLYAGAAGNVAYAAFKLSAGIIYDSDWFVAIAGYYCILSIIRFGLMWIVIKNTKNTWHCYRTSGIMMLILNMAMTTIASYIIWKNETYSYPGYVIYASAAYTFYSVTIAVINLVKIRSLNNPALSASRMLSFAGALMSVFTLQTAMLTQFGDTSVSVNAFANAITGGGVCLVVFCMAVYMIRSGSSRIKEAGH